MKNIIKKIIGSPSVRKTLLRFFFWLDHVTYRGITVLAVLDNNGNHPKHDLMKYHEFFVANIHEGDTVIDIGCGNGANAFDVAKKAKKVVAIDIEKKNIEKARKKFSSQNIEYIVGDALVYNFNATFDAIVLSNVLEHIEDRIDFLSNAKKLSNKLLLRVPMIDRDWVVLFKKEKGFDYRLDPTHYIEFTMPILKKEIKQAGWHIDSFSIQFGECWAVLSHS